MRRTLLSLQTSFKVASSLTDVLVDTHRRKHLAYLMADQGALVNPDSTRNLPKQVMYCTLIYFVLEVTFGKIFTIIEVFNLRTEKTRLLS